MEIHNNFPKNWREIWSQRIMLCRFDTYDHAKKYLVKTQQQHKETLYIDIHPKDGYVVYKQG